MLVQIRTATIQPKSHFGPCANIVRVYSIRSVAYALAAERELTKAALEAYHADSGYYDDLGDGSKLCNTVGTMNNDELKKLQESWHIELDSSEQEVINTATEF